MKVIRGSLQVHLVLFLLLALFIACGRTPNPVFPRHKLAEPIESVYDATIYSYDALYALFPTTNYTHLESVYVATNGSDEGDGSATSPYRTVTRALDDVAQGGIVRVKAGTYRESITVYASGTYSNPVVICSEDGHGRAIIDGKGNTPIQTTSNYIVVDGLTLSNSRKFGVGVYSGEDMTGTVAEEDAGGKYCVVRNAVICDVYEEGVKGAQNRYYLIEGNEIYNVRGEQGVDCVGSWHVIIKSNYFHDCAGGAGYCKGGSANVYWVGNTIVGSESQLFGIILGGVSSLYVTLRGIDPATIPEGYEQYAYNNRFINCGRMAILITSAVSCAIYNNTFYNCNYARNSLIEVANEGALSFARSSNIVVVNNVVKNDSEHPARYFISDPNGYDRLFTHAYNTFDPGGNTFLCSYSGYTFDETEETATVTFADANAYDFSLSAGSAARDTGTNVTNVVAYDYEGNARPQGGGFDRGAHEE